MKDAKDVVTLNVKSRFKEGLPDGGGTRVSPGYGCSFGPKISPPTKITLNLNPKKMTQ